MRDWYKNQNKQKLFLICVIAFVVLWNIFGLRFGFDMIVITLAVFGLLKGEGSQFVRDWLPAVLLFMLYELLRGQAFNVANSLWGAQPIVEGLITAERSLFFFLSDIPTVLLQDALRPDLTTYSWYDPVLFFFYSTFFWYWLAVGFILWAKKRELFRPFMYGLIGFSLIGVAIYLLAPSAPPWYASEHGFLPHLPRILWISDYLPSSALSIIQGYGRNDVAAFPSHHAAWPFFSSLFLIHAWGWKKMWPMLFVPLVIAFATWYGAEHYVIDSLAGWAIAYVVFLLVTKYKTTTLKYIPKSWQRI